MEFFSSWTVLLSTTYNNNNRISSFGIVLLGDTKQRDRDRDSGREKSTFDYHKRRLS